MTQGLDESLARIAAKKSELDALRPLSPAALAQLRKPYDIELTFTSNAIEGNTLTLRETAEVIEHGITVGRKPLRDHLEAQDHHAAVQWMHDLAQGSSALDDATVCELHRRIVLRSQPEIAGVYARLPRRIAGSAAVFPNPAKVPVLMLAFGEWLQTAACEPGTAFDTHFRLTAHPFADGNGRVAGLLINTMLVRAGYPPVAVRPEDRAAYLDVLEAGSAGDLAPFQRLMHGRLEATLDDYLAALRQALR